MFVSGPGHMHRRRCRTRIWKGITRGLSDCSAPMKLACCACSGLFSSLATQQPVLNPTMAKGYSLSYGFGAAFDNPGSDRAVMWSATAKLKLDRCNVMAFEQILNPAALPSGTADPASERLQDREPDLILARIPQEESALMTGLRYKPHFVSGSDPATMHELMAQTFETCIGEIRGFRRMHVRTATPRARG